MAFGVARCPSVHPSVCHVGDCVHTAEDNRLLSLPGSPIILVFWPRRRYPVPRGTRSAGAQNARGWENFAIFDWNRCLSRKRYETMLWNVIIGSHIRSIEWRHFLWPWQTPEPLFKVMAFFEVGYLKNGASWGLSYYRTLTGNHFESIEWYHFQWPWLTLDPDFEVAIFFDIEYLRNDMK